MTLKIKANSDGEIALLRLSGRIEEDHLEEIRAQVRHFRPRLVFDLAEATLVDRVVVRFLVVTKPGRYAYICGIHSGMRGMVIVTDKAMGTPAAALQRGRAERAATLEAGRGAFSNLQVERHGTTFVVPLVGNSQQQRYSVCLLLRA